MASVTAFMGVLPRIGEAVLLIFLGYQLKATGIFKSSDGETAIKLGICLTLPSLILQATNTHPPLTLAAGSGLLVVLVSSALSAGFNWLYNLQRLKRDRAVLSGCSVGSAVPLLVYPLVEALWGLQGVAVLAATDIAASAIGIACSYLLFASAGPAHPQDFRHEDGGVYNGEWRGMRKEGLGVYTYPSGARYEGEWAGNQKAGRGVYYYPSGGTYEGEWADGTMDGVGVRTFSSGRVQAGRWRAGRLELEVDIGLCANAAEGAAEAALAARRVPVGGGTLEEAVQQLALYPPLWAALLGLGLNLARVQLPGSVDLLTAALAPASKPLMLLAAGMTLPFALPQPRQVADAAATLAARVVPALAAASLLLAALGSVAPAAAVPLCVALLACCAPLPAAALRNCKAFRLNQVLAEGVASASVLACLPLILLLGLAAAALGLAPAVPPAAAAGALQLFVPGPSAAVSFAIVLLVAAAAAVAASAYLHDRFRTDQTVRMVFQGVPAAAGAAPAGAAGSLAAGEGKRAGKGSTGATSAAPDDLASSAAGLLALQQAVEGGAAGSSSDGGAAQAASAAGTAAAAAQPPTPGVEAAAGEEGVRGEGGDESSSSSSSSASNASEVADASSSGGGVGSSGISSEAGDDGGFAASTGADIGGGSNSGFAADGGDAGGGFGGDAGGGGDAVCSSRHAGPSGTGLGLISRPGCIWKRSSAGGLVTQLAGQSLRPMMLRRSWRRLGASTLATAVAATAAASADGAAVAASTAAAAESRVRLGGRAAVQQRLPRFAPRPAVACVAAAVNRVRAARLPACPGLTWL